jgi:hypothetical protein
MDGTQESPEVNALLDAARIPLSITAASIALAGAGLVVALVGLQNMTLIRWAGTWKVLPYALLIVGAAGIAVGAKLVRARGWSLSAALVVSSLLALGATFFFMLASMSGLFTLLALIGLGAGITALVMTVLAVGPFRRLRATRVKLRDAGFDLDL